MKKIILPSQKVGITEAGDPVFNLDIFDNLYRANIIITKNLTDSMIERLVKNSRSVILHMTCTGHGGTMLEPNVPAPEVTRMQMQKLLDAGFPASHVVLRIDPILPTVSGRKTAYYVAALFAGLGITRLRYSILDMYPHVKARLSKQDMPVPYTTFHASYAARKATWEGIAAVGARYGYTVEACGEPDLPPTPCLSQKDIDILGLRDKIFLESSAGQRKTCGCPANKSELIRKGRPHRCEHKCVYCFWKDKEETEAAPSNGM
ncbi:MAG: DUF1848 family protein [Bacteroidales bacterium]|nr:DUF1848 family protein [Bacteroidales bacterium]